jgi:CRISPR-associated protein Cas1
LQEPFRWLADVAVIEAFESGALDLSDFYFTGDDYRYRFEAGAKQRFIQVLRERLNSGAKYRGRMLKWDTVVEQKITELGRFLIGKTSSLDSAQPVPSLERMDSRELRSKILALTQLGARELGIGKSTCHYLREKARCSASFRFHSKVRRLLTSPVVAREMEREL